GDSFPSKLSARPTCTHHNVYGALRNEFWSHDRISEKSAEMISESELQAEILKVQQAIDKLTSEMPNQGEELRKLNKEFEDLVINKKPFLQKKIFQGKERTTT
ncbi:hypothetical protein PENTCL1PPCAC_8542, partial [Pristionchus entomophagus]